MIDFNYFDITIAAIVLILGIKGFVNGFIKEVAGLVGLVVGVFLASRLSDRAATVIDSNFLHLQNNALLKLLGFLTILGMVWLTAIIIGAIFSKLINHEPTLISRFLGFLSGAGKYFIIFALIVTALSNVQLAKDKLYKFVEKSHLYPYLVKSGSLLIHIDTPPLSKEVTTPTKDGASKGDTNKTTPQEVNQTQALSH